MRSSSVLVVIGAVAAAGCVRDVRPEVVSVFAVAGVDDPAVAVGSTTELRFGILEELGDGSLSQTTLTATGARSLDPSVLEVVDFRFGGARSFDGHAVVQGRRAGRARIVVEARGRTHEVVVRVTRPASARIADPLERTGVPPSRIVYVAGHEARLDLELTAPPARAARAGAFGSRSARIVRGDRALTPSMVSVAGPASLAGVSDTHLTLDLAGPGVVTVELLGVRRRLTVVAPSDVFAVELAVSDTSFGSGCLARPFDDRAIRQVAPPDRGERFSYLVARARTRDDRFVGNADALVTVATTTPAHCTLRPTTRKEDLVHLLRFFGPPSAGYHPRGYELLGSAPGTCTLTAIAATASTERRVGVE